MRRFLEDLLRSFVLTCFYVLAGGLIGGVAMAVLYGIAQAFVRIGPLVYIPGGAFLALWAYVHSRLK